MSQSNEHLFLLVIEFAVSVLAGDQEGGVFTFHLSAPCGQAVTYHFEGRAKACLRTLSFQRPHVVIPLCEECVGRCDATAK